MAKRAKKQSHLRAAYDAHDPEQYSTTIEGETMTEQFHKDACDVNNIMAKYQTTGVLDHVAKYEPQYGEVEATDYNDAMCIIASANSMFEELPSRAREHFHNDPAEFLEYVTDLDDTKMEMMKDLGLTNGEYMPPLNPNAIPTPTEAKVATEEDPEG